MTILYWARLGVALMAVGAALLLAWWSASEDF
jgi:hypothetical protein